MATQWPKLRSTILYFALATLISSIQERGMAASGSFPEPSTLVMVQALWRHGDRTPIYTYPNDPHQAEAWPQGFGQLTTLGMQQHVTLGKRLRQRYITDLGFISPNYTVKELHIYSTDVDRTLLSCVCNMIGLFPPAENDQSHGASAVSSSSYHPDIPEWPSGYTPIPVHTVSRAEDDILLGPHHCRRYNSINKHFIDGSQLTKRVTKENEWLLSYLSHYTGLVNASLDDVWWVADALNIEERWKRTLPEWATPVVRRQMANISDLTFNWTNGLGLEHDDPPLSYSHVPPLDFHLEIARMDGGRLLWAMIDRMLAKLRCLGNTSGAIPDSGSTAGVNNDDGGGLKKKAKKPKEDCSTLAPLKFYAYSGHEINLSQLLATLNITRTNLDKDGFPPFASCITVELWRRGKGDVGGSLDTTSPLADSAEMGSAAKSAPATRSAISGKYHVRVFFWAPSDDSSEKPIEITHMIKGCGGQESNGMGCLLKRFIHRSKPYRMVPSERHYCADLSDLHIERERDREYNSYGTNISASVLGVLISISLFILIGRPSLILSTVILPWALS